MENISKKNIDLSIIESNFDPRILQSVKSKKNGVWKEYRRNDIDSARDMYDSLKNKKTGWSISESLDTAEFYNKKGDIFIYYEEDESGEFTVPKIKIGFISSQLFDVRGVDFFNSLEREYLLIANDKIKELRDINKSNSKNTSSFDQSFNGITSYFILAFLTKNPYIDVSKEILSGLYREKYYGFTYNAPYKDSINDDMDSIYKEVYQTRDVKADEKVLSSRTNTLDLTLEK